MKIIITEMIILTTFLIIIIMIIITVMIIIMMMMMMMITIVMVQPVVSHLNTQDVKHELSRSYGTVVSPPTPFSPPS